MPSTPSPWREKVGIGSESASAACVLSARTASTSPPGADAMSWAVLCTSSSRRAQIARRDLSAQNGKAVARPIPAPPPGMDVTLPRNPSSIALPLMRSHAWSVVGSRARRAAFVPVVGCARPALGNVTPLPATDLSRHKPSSLRPVWCGCPWPSGRCGRRPNPLWLHANAFPLRTRAQRPP